LKTGLRGLLAIGRWPAKRVLRWAAFLALAVAGFYALQFALFIVSMAHLLHTRDLMDASATNGRGDVVAAETDFFGAPEHRSKTVISLKRAGHWFSTTLLESRSWEVLVGLHWKDDNTLDLQLEFGYDTQTSGPVTKVGPINVLYHFGDPGHTPKPGYESFRRRDTPRRPTNLICRE
jgi:hypothetical protein